MSQSDEEKTQQVQQVFQECGSAEGLNRQQAYFALCLLKHNPTPHEIEEFFNSKGKGDGDNACLRCEEFHDLVKGLGNSDEALRRAFRFFDKDGSGKIDRVELKEILRINAKVGGSGEDIEDWRVEDTLDLCDTSGDGLIDIDELVKAINDNVPIFDV